MTIVPRCIECFLIGIGILMSVWRFRFFSLVFPILSIATYFDMGMVFVIVGIVSSLVWTQYAGVYSIFLALPTAIMLGPLNFSDAVLKMSLFARVYIPLIPILSALIGAYAGNRIALRKKKVNK